MRFEAQEKLLDVEVLRNLVALGKGRENPLLVQLFELFRAQGPASIAVLRQAMEQRDTKQMRETAHSLKGSYRSLGAARLGELATGLEKRAMEANFEDCGELIDRLELEFSETLQALDDFVRSNV